MANFNEHIEQAKSNLDFLLKVNKSINDRWDWQFTIVFYTSLHLINAHIANKMDKNYLTHNKVEEVLNPYNSLSVAKLDENIYTSYIKLSHLSRRARYLLNENFKKDTKDIHPVAKTYSKHLKKAIFHLDKLLCFMNKEYDCSFANMSIDCIDIKTVNEYQYFN